MADPECPAFQASKTGAQRHIESVEYNFPELVCVMPCRQHDRRQDVAIFLGASAKYLEPPSLHRGARSFGQAAMSLEHVLQPFLLQHHQSFTESEEQICRGRVWEETCLIGPEHRVPRPI